MWNESPEEEINRLKDEEKKEAVAPPTADLPRVTSARPPQAPRRRRKRPSLTGPLILIAIGAYFLLRNLGVDIGPLNWEAAFRFWPLFLVAGGINILSESMRSPLRGMVRGVTSAFMIAFFGYMLLFSGNGNFAPPAEAIQWNESQVTAIWPAAESADISLDFGANGGDVFGMPGSEAILDGTVYYSSGYDWSEELDGSVAELDLDTSDGFDFGTFLDGADRRSRIGLGDSVPIDLEVDVGAGPVNLDLAEVQLDALTVDSGAGASTFVLPAGTYTADIDVGAGATRVELPATGNINVEIDGGAGAIDVIIPAGAAVQISVDTGVGAINVPSGWIETSNNVWQSPNYADADEQIDVSVDVGAGAVTLREG